MIRNFVCACSLFPLAATAGGFDEHLLMTPHPGRAEAVDWVSQGREAFLEKDALLAERAFEMALDHDPLLAAAWINLCATRVHLGMGHRALFACQMALWLLPNDRDLATNMRLAARLSRKEAVPAPDGDHGKKAGLEYALTRDASNISGWVELADLARAEGRLALALVFEERALESGADRSALVCRVQRDLQNFGLLRRALEILELEQEGGAEIGACRANIASLRERIEALRSASIDLAKTVALEAGLREPEEVDGVVRLAEVVLTRAGGARGGGDVAERLREILGVGTQTVESGAWGRLTFPPQWVRLRPEESEEWPLLVMRRFPGDTQILIFSWPSDSTAERESPEETIARLLADRDAVFVEPWAACESARSDRFCLKGIVDLDQGAEGRAKSTWRLMASLSETKKERDTPHFALAVATVIGDSGCGDPCRAMVEAEVEEIFAEAKWRMTPPSASAEVLRAWRWPVPSAWQARREHREDSDPWRTFVTEGGVSIDLPPGVVAALPTTGFGDGHCSADTVLWFRGRWIGRDGEALALGNADWAGTMSLLPGGAEQGMSEAGLAQWTMPSDPVARQTHRVDLSAPLETLAGAKRGVVARFGGGEFSGTWLAMRLDLSGDLVEIRLPILENADSSSWLWIPMTVRHTDAPPPPVLVDLSERFAVRFRSNEDRDNPADPREGHLSAGEISLDVPKGFRVSLNPDSRNGFPIRMRDDQGTVLKLERLRRRSQESAEDVKRRVRKTVDLPIDGKWHKSGRGRRGVVWHARFASGDGAAVEWLFLLVAEGSDSRPIYTLHLSGGRSADALWMRSMVRVLGGSLRFRR